jgi:imidazolonepropionase-like amidohydrolase
MPNGVVALVNARLLDGSGGAPVAFATIVVEGGRFTEVGTDTAAAVPAGATVVDLGGATVVPGVVDAHVHLAFAGDPRRMLEGGVTAVRDLGWPPARMAALVREGQAAGLLVQHTGPILTAPGGYPTRAAWAPPGTGREVATADEARLAIDDAMAAGACAVKLAMEDRAGPTLGAAMLDAIVEHAAVWGRPTTVHAGSADAVEACLAAGVDELAHVPFRLLGASGDLAERCARAGMGLVPTLHCRQADADAERAAAVEFLRRWVAAGGAVRYGTDLGNTLTAPGVDADELLLLQAGGLSAAEVLVAATSAAAEAIGAGDVVGRIVPGHRADLLVLDEDPLSDVTALARPTWVVAEGRLVAP